MKIAALTDDAGHLLRFPRPGTVRLFEGEPGAWGLSRDIPFDPGPRGDLPSVKAALYSLRDDLGDCRVVIAAATPGALPSILSEELGLRLWIAAGAAAPHLDAIARQDAEKVVELAARKAAEPSCSSAGCGSSGCGPKEGAGAGPCLPPAARLERVADGHFRFDLAGALAADPASNSRLLLVPLLEERHFERLDILCDHPPRWFQGTLAQLGLSACIVPAPAPGQGVVATVSPLPPQ